MANAGRVSMVPKGIWDDQTTYKRLDTVRIDNVVYIAKQDNSGVDPRTDDEETYWMKAVSGVTQDVATDLSPGLMSASDKKKLDSFSSQPISNEELDEIFKFKTQEGEEP